MDRWLAIALIVAALGWSAGIAAPAAPCPVGDDVASIDATPTPAPDESPNDAGEEPIESDARCAASTVLAVAPPADCRVRRLDDRVPDSRNLPPLMRPPIA